MLGMKIGLDRAFDIEVPADNDNPQIAGKTVSFKVSLKGIKKLELPALDEEFAKDVGAESIQQLKDKLRDGLTNVQTMRVKNHVRDQLVDRLIERHTFEVPQSLVAEQTKLMFSELVRRASMEGMDVSSLGREEVEGLTQQYWPKAERNVRFFLLVGELAKAEKLEVSDEDIEAEITRLADLSQQDPLRVRSMYKDRDRRDNLRFQLLEDKVLGLLEQNATVSDADPLPEDKRQLL
jgi:trigger factor